MLIARKRLLPFRTRVANVKRKCAPDMASRSGAGVEKKGGPRTATNLGRDLFSIQLEVGASYREASHGYRLNRQSDVDIP